MLGTTVPCSREALAAFARTMLRPDDRVALKATTNTWAVVDVVKPFVGSVTTSNPLRTKEIADAKVKTDKVDAEGLVQLLRCDYLPAVWEPDEETRRQLTAYRTGLVGDRTRVKNRLQFLLNQRLISRRRSTCSAAAAGCSGCGSWNCRKLTARWSTRSSGCWRRSTPSCWRWDRELPPLVYGEDRAKLLMTLPGVSHGTALSLLAALGDVTPFRDGDHAASYVGLVTSTRQSADRCYHGPITKAGNLNARWMLTQGVQHVVNHPGPPGVFFRRLCKRKNRNVAVTAVARKLGTIAYLMRKNTSRTATRSASACTRSSRGSAPPPRAGVPRANPARCRRTCPARASVTGCRPSAGSSSCPPASGGCWRNGGWSPPSGSCTRAARRLGVTGYVCRLNFF